MTSLRQLSKVLHRFSTGRTAVISLGIFVVFTAVVLPWQAAEANRIAQGAGSPDTSLWYTPAALYTMAETYGAEGRQAYLRARWTFDVIWPLVYTGFLVATISWLARRVFVSQSRWQALNLIPVLAMILDFLENTAASIVFARYPVTTPVAAQLAPVFTLLKWVFVSGSFSTGVALAFAALQRRLRRSPHHPSS